MYEKYTGLPDTTKSTPKTAGRAPDASHTASRDAKSAGAEIYYAPNRGGSSGGRSSTSRSSGGSSGGRSSGSSGGRRGSSKRARARKRKLVVSLMTVGLLALLVLAIVTIARGCKDVAEPDPAVDAFRSGVYINGANVSGKTIDEVRAQLETNESYAINNIAVALSGEGVSATISGADMSAYSNLEEVMATALAGGSDQDYYTTISVDHAALLSRIDAINATLATPPVDASFTVTIDEESGKPSFTYLEGQAGYGLDAEATAQLVEAAIAGGQYQTSIQPTLTVIQPSVTVEDVKLHTTLIGSYTTTYDFKGTAEDTEEQRTVLIPNRAFNVEKAAEMINNQVVKPGRTWSFNTVVGDRNEKNGWKEANGILGGDKLTLQFGGGVCQVSTTLYNALLECYSSIELVERRKHSFPSTYVDEGLDATVDSDHIDFRFKNISDQPMYIFAFVSKNKKASTRKRDITVLIYGEALPAGVTYEPHTEIVEEIPPGEDEITETKNLFVGEEQITAEARTGYVVDVYVNRYLDGVLQESIFLYTDRYEGNPLRKKVGTKPTPTPVVSPTPSPDPDDQP